jgi:GT2 family glycosyltransferase
VSKLVVGVPVYRRYDLLNNFLASVRGSELKPDLVVIVDNGNGGSATAADPGCSTAIKVAGKNLGCAGAWNSMFDYIQPDDLVVISNDDIVLAPESLSLIVAAASETDLVIAHGFSLFALKRRLVDEVGYFDENFHPCYYEDLDFHRRVKLAKKSWTHLDAHAKHPEPSATLKSLNQAERKVFDARLSDLKRYYMMKWGGVPPKTDERYDQPFRGGPPRGWKLRPQTQP